VKCDSQASISACTFANLCFGCKPKARVATLVDVDIIIVDRKRRKYIIKVVQYIEKRLKEVDLKKKELKMYQ
jgi:hypothetical protein